MSEKLENLENYEVPPLGSILAYRGVYALCTINKEGMLRATHYATCLVGGREPWWGVWSVNGVFQRFFSSKNQITEAYPRLTWRRKNATWNMLRIDGYNAKEKKAELAKVFHKGSTNAHEPLAALFPDGDVRAWSSNYEGKAKPVYAGELTLKVS